MTYVIMIVYDIFLKCYTVPHLMKTTKNLLSQTFIDSKISLKQLMISFVQNNTNNSNLLNH